MSQEKNLWRKQPIPNSDRVGFGEVVWQAGAKPDQHVCILYFVVLYFCIMWYSYLSLMWYCRFESKLNEDV